jgi:uncharacterized membrane protein YphA (DoxX/SURF4 family)
MEQVNRLKEYLEGHRELIFEVVRVYLGFGLFAKGVYFVTHVGDVTSFLARGTVPLESIDTMLIGHYVAMAHLAGGLMLAAGLLTRLAAAVQVPILLGAVFIVHLREGFFGTEQNLELALLVLLLLALSVVHGGGKLSVDHYLARKYELQTATALRAR